MRKLDSESHATSQHKSLFGWERLDTDSTGYAETIGLRTLSVRAVRVSLFVAVTLRRDEPQRAGVESEAKLREVRSILPKTHHDGA